MCLLAFYPEGVQPDIEHLWNASLINQDGFGYAILDKTDNRIIVSKSLDFDPIVEEFEQMRKSFSDGPALFHLRLATHGETSLYNVHPFHYNHSKDTIIAHNGILPIVVQPSKKDPRSDTRILATQFLPKRTHLRFWTKLGKKRLEEFIGRNNKLVFLTTNPTHGKNYHIINENEGIWDENGVWYSNDWYLPYIPKYTKKWWEDGEMDKTGTDWQKCPSCFSYGTIGEYTRVCTFCYMCVDCDKYVKDCTCWYPGKSYGETDKASIGTVIGPKSAISNTTDSTANREVWEKFVKALNKDEIDNYEEELDWDKLENYTKEDEKWLNSIHRPNRTS